MAVTTKFAGERLAYRVIPVVILLALLLYLLPVALLSDFGQIWNHPGTNQLLTVIFRSITFALMSAGLCTSFGFLCALYFRNYSLNSLRGKWLSVLIIPFLLGNVSVAYLFKMLLLDSTVKAASFDNPWLIYGQMLLIQLWQFGSLFAYLSWLSLTNISPNKLAFLKTADLNYYEQVKDIYLPHAKNLLVLLFLIGFVFAFYEDVKLTLIFSVSPGTDSELISHWLYRRFRSDLLINFPYAAQGIASYSLMLILPIAFMAFLLCSFLLSTGLSSLSRCRWSPKNTSISHDEKKEGLLGFMLVLGLLATPIVYLLLTRVVNLDNDVGILWRPLWLTTLASLAATLLAIALSISLRLLSPVGMGGFNTKSILVLTALYTVRLAPPIVLLIAGFKWLDYFDLSRQSGITFFWVMGHCMLSLPLLASFLVISHFRLDYKELEYLSIFKISEIQKVWRNFILRFRGEYLLTFLFATTIIWNESVINRVFSDYVPSFVSILLRTISSRQADYSDAMLFLLISLLLAAACLLLWSQSLSKMKLPR